MDHQSHVMGRWEEAEDFLGKEHLFSEYMTGVSEGGGPALPGLGQMTRLSGSYRSGNFTHTHENVRISLNQGYFLCNYGI